MSGAVEGVALREALMAWEPDGDDRVRPLLLAEADRRDALEYNLTDANHVIAFLLHRLDASLTTPPARSYAAAIEDAAKVADDYALGALEGGEPLIEATAETIAAAIRVLSQEPRA